MAIAADIVITTGIEALGTTAATAGAISAIATPALIGAGIGAAGAGITGGDPLTGALQGGLTGGIGGGIGSAGGLGLSSGAQAALAGGLGGGITSAIEGGNVLKGAATGGAESFAFNALTGGGKPAPAATGGGAPGGAAMAAPMSIGAVSPDATAAVSGGTSLPGSGGGGAGLPGSVGGGAAAGGSAGASGLNTSAGEVTGLGGGGAPPSITGAASSPVSLTGGPDTSSLISSPNLAAAKVPGMGMLDTFVKNPFAATSALGLGANVLRGNKLPAGFNQIQSEAGRLGAQGAQLQGYLTGGTLPPGMQAGVTAAGDAAAASIKSQYAQRGMSGSSAEAQDLASLQQRLVTQGAEMAAQLFSQGVSETGLADQLYVQLMQTQMAQDQQTSQAVGNFASALASFGQKAA